jgi:hypothetical protein
MVAAYASILTWAGFIMALLLFRHLGIQGL